jgi:hypothetical protein
MSPPSYMKGRKPLKVPLHSVMDILKSIDDLGHSDKFRQAAKDKGTFVTIHPAAVNFVKDYLATNNLHERNDVARNVVGACPGDDPYNCPYSQND